MVKEMGLFWLSGVTTLMTKQGVLAVSYNHSVGPPSQPDIYLTDSNSSICFHAYSNPELYYINIIKSNSEQLPTITELVINSTQCVNLSVVGGLQKCTSVAVSVVASNSLGNSTRNEIYILGNEGI